jgi:ribose 5-phosphate isomerase B
LTDRGYEVVDHGPVTFDPMDDYPVFCLRAAEAVGVDRYRGMASLGIVLGGSGNGEQIAANKVPGIRAALAWNPATAALARQHNDAQVVAIGGRMHTFDEVTEVVQAFLTTEFSGDERHDRRIEMLLHYEETEELPPLPRSALGSEAGPSESLRSGEDRNT